MRTIPHGTPAVCRRSIQYFACICLTRRFTADAMRSRAFTRPAFVLPEKVTAIHSVADVVELAWHAQSESSRGVDIFFRLMSAGMRFDDGFCSECSRIADDRIEPAGVVPPGGMVPPGGIVPAAPPYKRLPGAGCVAFSRLKATPAL